MPKPAEAPPAAPKRLRGRWPVYLLVAVVGLTALGYVLGEYNLFGYSMLAIPFVFCFALGWFIQADRQFLMALALLVVVSGLIGVVLFGFAGVICSVITGVVILVPSLAGALLGRWMEGRLRRRHGTSPGIAPLLLFFVVGTALPIEKRLAPTYEPETVSTRRVLELPAEAAWDRILFYEEVPFEPPLLARVGVPHPIRTEGRVTGVGDVKRCVYTTGHLRKRITRFDPGVELGFDVVEQLGIEDRSAELLTGSFRFEPLDNGRTVVTLETTYRPLLQARLVWRPWERAVAHMLHGHVLDGMERSRPAEPARLAELARR